MLALMNSRAAISRLVKCPATSRTICSSCGVSTSGAPGPRRRACSPVGRSSARERAVRSWSLASRRRLLLRSAGRRCGPRSPAPIQSGRGAGAFGQPLQRGPDGRYVPGPGRRLGELRDHLGPVAPARVPVPRQRQGWSSEIQGASSSTIRRVA